jgi:hypothetical protein
VVVPHSVTLSSVRLLFHASTVGAYARKGEEVEYGRGQAAATATFF